MTDCCRLCDKPVVRELINPQSEMYLQLEEERIVCRTCVIRCVAAFSTWFQGIPQLVRDIHAA